MEEKQFSAADSIAVITAMIERTKYRVALPDLRVSVAWGIITIVVAVAVYAGLLLSRNPMFNILWLAIPVIGLPVQVVLSRRQKLPGGGSARSYVDRLCEGVWKSVGLLAVVISAVCLGFNLCGYPQAWLAMLFYAFIIIGFAAMAQGLIVREKSYVVGGFVSVVAGSGVVCASVSGFPLLAVWVIPLYVLCFAMMFVVPALVIRRKIRKGL